MAIGQSEDSERDRLKLGSNYKFSEEISLSAGDRGSRNMAEFKWEDGLT